MMRKRFISLVLAWAVSCTVQAAEQVCYIYSISSNAQVANATGTGSSAEAACSDLAAQKSGAEDATYVYFMVFKEVTQEGPTGFSCNFGFNRTRKSTGVNTVQGDAVISGNKTETECPTDPCSELAGLLAFGGTYTEPGNAPFCQDGDADGPGNMCKVVKAGSGIATGGGWYGQVRMTGESCDGSEGADLEANAPNCETTSGGTVCITKSSDESKRNCGTVNGEAVCLADVPPGNCMLLASGGAICTEDAENAPTDAMGEPVTPTKQIEGQGDSGTNNYNYYSSSIVNNSGTPVTGTANGDEGDGDDEEEEEEEPCDSVEECVGGLGELDGIQGATSAYMARIQGSGIVQAVSGIGSSIPSGSCPVPTFDAFGETLSLSAMCDILDPVLPIISAVMLFMWAVMAARVLMSA